ncbi:MAG TPA: hypothetical protein VFD82_09805 [Planctomycetota bacterium]|nr:hypothetical protein [Planctomycetota bacterium]
MLRSCFCSFFVTLLLAGLAAAQTVQFADGRVLLATVENADGQGLRVKRLDNGGTLDLRWDHLSAACALAIKQSFDLVGENQDEALVRCDEVAYLLNGSRQTQIGKIVETTATEVVVQTKGVTYRVPKASLVAVRSVEVPVTQVFTKDEYYAQRLAALQPGQSSDKHMLLAEELIKVRDYDHAAEHLTKAKELGNSKNPPHLDALLQRLARFKEAAKELKLLEEIQAARSRAKPLDFEKGVKLIAQFEKDFPQTKLKAEFDKEKDRFTKARTKVLSQLVADSFRRSIQFVAEKKLAEEGTTLQAAREYAESKMTDDIVAKLVAQLKLEAAEIKQLWTDRANYPVGKRSEHFSYGIGSWVLGEEKILKDTDQSKAAKPDPAAAGPATTGSDAEKYKKLVREAYERRRADAQGEQGGKQLTEEDWWRGALPAERNSWLRAYYAEFGGQLVLTYRSVERCMSCYALGTTTAIGTDGKMEQVPCFLCQKTKWVRSFKAY